MTRFVLTAALAVSCAALAVAADTKPAAATRKRLKEVKITVTFDDTSLKDVLAELESQVEAAGTGNIKFKPDTGVSRNLKITYKAVDKALADVLAGLFDKNGLGYVVLSKDKDRYDGWVLIRPGKERGYEAGQEPAKEKDKTVAKEKEKDKDKAAAKDKTESDDERIEQRAASRLSQAKQLAQDGKKAKAKQYCEEILSSYPNTKAADDARKLLKDLDK